MPKTSLGKRAAIEQLKNFGVINPQNPDTAYRILQIFGATDLWPGLDYDVKSALQEQDAFEQWALTVQFMAPQPMVGPAGALITDPATGQPTQTPPQPDSPPPGQLQIWHNSLVHAAEHRKWANGDTARELFGQYPILEQFFTAHLQAHQMAMMPPAPPPTPQRGGAMERSNSESGKSHDRGGSDEGADRRGPE